MTNTETWITEHIPMHGSADHSGIIAPNRTRPDNSTCMQHTQPDLHLNRKSSVCCLLDRVPYPDLSWMNILYLVLTFLFHKRQCIAL